MVTIEEIWEKERKNHFGYCNIDKYHATGYKGKGINFLNLEDSEHGNKVCKVFSEVAPEVKIYKGTLTGITNGTPLTKFDITVDGVRKDFETFVVNNNIKVINCSKGDGRVQVISEFMKRFIIDKHGVILTNSAGNDGDQVTGSFRDVGIVVGAVNYNNGFPIRAGYSGQGEEVMFSTFAHLFTGTSFSAPFLAGMIALLLEKYGNFNQAECIEILKSYCVDLGEVGDDDYFGWGIPILPLTDRLEILEKMRGTEEMKFTDVNKCDWFHDEVEKAANEGLIKGYEDGTFKPNNNITRAEVSVIANRILEKIRKEL